MDYATTLNIDQQGRIIIPAKVRKALQLHTGDVLMLEADTRNICLRKCDSHIPMDIRLDSFLDILHSNVPCRILLCNHSKIIASKNYHTALNMPVTESIQRLTFIIILPLESTFFFDIMKANGGITYMSIQSDIEMLSIEALEHLVFESRKDM